MNSYNMLQNILSNLDLCNIFRRTPRLLINTVTFYAYDVNNFS